MICPLLVDSSWHRKGARNGSDPMLALAEISELLEIAVCARVKAEEGRGLRTPKGLRRYMAAWGKVLFIESAPELWDKTHNLYW